MCIREPPEPERRDEQVDKMSNQALQELVRQCLQTSPDDRPDMKEIIDKLKQFQEMHQESCHIFKEGNVSFNTKNPLKQLAQSHTFQYVSMSRREIGISQSNISFSFWRVIRLYDFVSFFGFLMFWCFSSSYNTYTILMALNFLTESSLYVVYLRFTGKKKHRPLDSIRIVFCTREKC